MALGEFELIQRYFSAFSAVSSDAVALGIGDDCALLNLRPGEQLATSVDTLVCGIHFLEFAPPHLLAERALAVCVSDLAACGARPLGYTLALTLPAVDEHWLEGFSRGLAAASARFAIDLIGGDTTRGPLSISVQVLGALPAGQALLRSGARAGDQIWVSGSLGDARAALDRLDRADAEADYFLQRYYRPQPPLAFAQTLRKLASAAIDISDGLLADLGHIAVASGLGARIENAALPLSPALRDSYPVATAREYALTGGDDYELCFTSSAAVSAIEALAKESGVVVTHVGEMTAEPGVLCVDENGEAMPVSAQGYQHFS